ncbi:MAG: T9SS-dependent M36 family metallopeptidase [Leeuwenhoekiella sp.]
MFKKLLPLLAVLVMLPQLYAQDYRSIIDKFLAENQSQSKLPENFDYNIVSELPSKRTGITHIYTNQLINGIGVSGTTSVFTLKDNEVIYAAPRFVKQSGKTSYSSPQLNPLDAVYAAAKRLHLETPLNLRIKTVQDKRNFELSPGNISKENIPVLLVYFPTKTNQLKLAWDLNIHTKDGNHWWSAKIDAATGQLLQLNDWILSCTFTSHNHGENKSAIDESQTKTIFKPFRENLPLMDASYQVYALPLASPQEGNRSVVINPADSLASPFGWHDTDGMEGAEFTTTQGNNAIALNITPIDSLLIFAEGGANLVFESSVDFDESPFSYQNAVITNLFYVNNKVHDISYHYGFDEMAGNFQVNNYGRGPTGNIGGEDDPVVALAQDSNGTNNATFGTPEDGSNPVMRMFLWPSTETPNPALTVNSPDGIAGDYVVTFATFGPPLPEVDAIVGDLAIVLDDDSGEGIDDPNDGCDVLTNSENAFENKIAVVRRGNCDFTAKVFNAQVLGALAVIVVNNTDDPIVPMNGENDDINIPSVMISKSTGNLIIQKLQNNETINVSLKFNGPYALDGSFDNGVIIHEYAHGISNRLTGGRNDTDCLLTCTERNDDDECISGTYTEQMGEGWSDFYALLYTLKASDDGTNGRAIATYLTRQPITGEGIRPARYSTDFDNNDYTYEDTNDLTLSAPHGVGFVWGNMLWEMTWDLIDVYGFDPDVYNGTGGNNIAIQLVTEALKMQPCQPGFVDGRDAILAADLALYEGRHQCLIYQAFARRGLGLSAEQGEATSRTDQVEAFDLPPEFEGNCSLNVDDIQSGKTGFSVYPNPTSGTVNITFLRDMGTGTITIYDLNGRKVFSKENSLSGTVELGLNAINPGVYLVKITDGNSHTNTRKLIIK